MKKLFLPRTVIVLGLVSFLNDTASEMITPLLPVFLTATLGVGPAVVGLVEGVAEATASVLKLVSGRMADRGWNPNRLVLGGYSVSNLARPLIGLALGWNLVLLFRFLDRVGKGLRTSPRDALIAGSIDSSQLGKAFGFHRALDNAGTMLGPLCAWYLLRENVRMGHIFLWSLLPGILVVSLLVFGLEAAPAPAKSKKLPPLRWSILDRRLRTLILATGGLALASAPEAFLVLWATEQGIQVVWVPLIWTAASAVKTVVAGPAGSLSDGFGRLPVLLFGWILRILLLFSLAWSCSGIHPVLVWVFFLAYAASLAATEGGERALIGDFAKKEERATAFGMYHMVVGLSALPGALLFGIVWQLAGPAVAFFINGIVAMLSVYLLYGKSKKV